MNGDVLGSVSDKALQLRGYLSIWNVSALITNIETQPSFTWAILLIRAHFDVVISAENSHKITVLA